MEPISWPADKVERWPIERLVPYARNARTHSDAQIAQVAASIREWGWTNPVLVGEDGGIIAGHCRVLAGRQLGLAEVPVMLATGWSEAQKRAYVLADNQLALNAGWNSELLRLELGELQGLDFNLGLIGFDDAELAALTANPGLTDPDEVPEPPAVPVAQVGEVWQLGRHRLVCGDATNAEDVAKVLGGVSPHLMVTDPPYGMNYQTISGPAQKGMTKNKRREVTPIAGDAGPFDPMPAVNVAGCDEVFLWGGDWFYEFLPAGGSWIVWDKRAADAADSIPGSPFEVCWSRIRHAREFIRVPWGGWNNKEQSESTRWHPTQKPIECMRRPIENNSSPGQAVYDPFVGSGTTIIAAEMTGRACYAVEINPTYCDVSIERWQNFTGEKARRA